MVEGEEGQIPILQMNDALDSYLWYVAEVEEDIGDYGETEEDGGGYEEEDGVEVCFLRGLGGCDAVGL